jgi:hypothetical protein
MGRAETVLLIGAHLGAGRERGAASQPRTVATWADLKAVKDMSPTELDRETELLLLTWGTTYADVVPVIANM